MFVSVGVAVLVSVGVGVFVGIGLGVFVGDGLLLGVGVGVGANVKVREGVKLGEASGMTTLAVDFLDTVIGVEARPIAVAPSRVVSRPTTMATNTAANTNPPTITARFEETAIGLLWGRVGRNPVASTTRSGPVSGMAAFSSRTISPARFP